MSSRSARECAALRQLEAWDGFSRIDSALHDIKSRPNFFHVVPRILRVEGVHTDMLAWLLNPTGWHGLTDHFARRLVLRVLADRGFDVARHLVVEEAHREFSTGRGPIDVLLQVRLGDDQIALGIENKIDAAEGEDQLPRYASGLTRKFGKESVVLVYLTPDGKEPRNPSDCPVVCLAYRAVVAMLEEAIEESSASVGDPTGLGLARHYCGALRNHIMSEQNPEIDAICRQLYDEHKEAWRAIRRRLPSERDECHYDVGSRVCKRLGNEHQGAWQFVVRRGKYVCVFRPDWFEFGFYETDPLVGLGEQSGVNNKYPRIHFRLVVDTPDTDAHERTKYEVRLKVDVRKDDVRGKSILEALKAVGDLKISAAERTKGQCTPKIGTFRILQPFGAESKPVSDDVVDRFTRTLSETVSALDPVFSEA